MFQVKVADLIMSRPISYIKYKYFVQCDT